MIEVLKVEKEGAHYHSLVTRELLLFTTGTLIYLTIVLLGLFLSGEHYLAQMWMLIALSVLYLWAALFFFGVLYRRDRAYERFYQAVQKGLREKQEIAFVSLSEAGLYTKEGLSAQLLKGTIEENGKSFERDYYVLGDFPSLEKGKRIALESFSSVVLSFEVLHE